MRCRYRNMDPNHKMEEILEVARSFMVKMANSGYNKATRWEVLRSATVKFYREKAEWLTGGKSLYRSKQEMATRRRFKALEATNWFRTRRGGKDERT